MRKREELTSPCSCLNKAQEDELLFVLLGRDRAAPVAVRAWIEERVRLDKNTRTDPQIVEAEAWIRTVEAEQMHTRRIELAEKKARGGLNIMEAAELAWLQEVQFGPFDTPRGMDIKEMRRRLEEIEGRLEKE